MSIVQCKQCFSILGDNDCVQKNGESICKKCAAQLAEAQAAPSEQIGIASIPKAYSGVGDAVEALNFAVNGPLQEKSQIEVEQFISATHSHALSRLFTAGSMLSLRMSLLSDGRDQDCLSGDGALEQSLVTCWEEALAAWKKETRHD